MASGPVIGAECWETTFTWADLSSLADSSLTDGEVLTVNVEVFPWVGTEAAGSVFRTSDQSAEDVARRGPIKLYKCGLNPKYAYIDTSGTGVLSETAATAYASPYSSLGDATAAAVSDRGACELVIYRYKSGRTTLGFQGSGTRVTRGFPMRIQAAPEDFGSGRAPMDWQSVRPRFTLGSTSDTNNRASLDFRRIDFTRVSSATYTADGVSADILMRDCEFEEPSSVGIIATTTGVSHRIFFYDTIFLRTATGSTNSTPTDSAHYAYGSSFRVSSDTVQYQNLNLAVMAGCFADRVSSFSNGPITAQTICVQDSIFYDPGVGSLAGWSDNSNSPSAVNLNGLAIYVVRDGLGDIFGVKGGDTSTGDCTNMLMQHFTLLGSQSNGRANMFYDNNATTARTHTFISRHNSVWRGRNERKGDITLADATRIGIIEDVHAVGTTGIVVATWHEFPHTTWGRGSLNTDPPQGDPTSLTLTNFHGANTVADVSTAGTRETFTADNLLPATGSILRRATVKHVRKFDLIGTVRDADDWPGVRVAA
jgi:hypothetical protein